MRVGAPRSSSPQPALARRRVGLEAAASTRTQAYAEVLRVCSSSPGIRPLTGLRSYILKVAMLLMS